MRDVRRGDKITVGIGSVARKPAVSPRQPEVNSFTLAKFTPSKEKRVTAIAVYI